MQDKNPSSGYKDVTIIYLVISSLNIAWTWRGALYQRIKGRILHRTRGNMIKDYEAFRLEDKKGISRFRITMQAL